MTRRSRDPLVAYTRAASTSASTVIRSYSGSVRTATRLLARRVRRPVDAIYALVRVADEIVDGAAAGAGLDPRGQRELLDALEAETERAMRTGYSANVVVHAFAVTARANDIGTELTRPFIAAMRRDLDPAPIREDELAVYIHGSTEVVGLMCLRVFLTDRPVTEAVRRRLESGARRLGAAAQKLDFLRDLAVDWTDLGRSYFPGLDPSRLTESQKLALLADIDNDLRAAAATIPDLPANCRRAIVAVHDLQSRIAAQIRATPAPRLLTDRMRVPASAKIGVLARAALPMGRRPPVQS